MSSSTPKPQQQDQPPQGGAPTSGGRRTILKIGALTAPLAIVTRPARATGDLCRAPSAYGSVHASGPGKQYATCTGRTPGYWKQTHHFDEWPLPYAPVSEPSSGTTASVFHGVGFNGSHFETMTLVQVLSEGGNAGHFVALGRHIVAALLNAAAGKTPVLTVGMVLDIWNEYAARGYYEPTAGVQWDEEQIVTYLKSTMPG